MCILMTRSSCLFVYPKICTYTYTMIYLLHMEFNMFINIIIEYTCTRINLKVHIDWIISLNWRFYFLLTFLMHCMNYFLLLLYQLFLIIFLQVLFKISADIPVRWSFWFVNFFSKHPEFFTTITRTANFMIIYNHKFIFLLQRSAVVYNILYLSRMPSRNLLNTSNQRTNNDKTKL